jgi:hypothetical protein
MIVLWIGCRDDSPFTVFRGRAKSSYKIHEVLFYFIPLIRLIPLNRISGKTAVGKLNKLLPGHGFIGFDFQIMF